MPVALPVSGAVGALPVVRPTGELVVAYLRRRAEHRLRRVGRRRRHVRCAGDGVGRPGARRAGPPLLPVPGCGRRPGVGSGLGDVARLPLQRGCAANSVVVSTSDDGRSWTPPTRVTSARNAFLPTIGVHPRTGRVALAYYVLRAGRRHRLRARRVASGRCGLGIPASLSAQTMRPGWLPDTVSGPDAGGLHLRALRGRAAARCLGARLGARRIEPAPGGLRDARLTRRRWLSPLWRYRPIGCQTVLSSRKASISQGLWASARGADDALDILRGELLELRAAARRRP